MSSGRVELCLAAETEGPVTIGAERYSNERTDEGVIQMQIGIDSFAAAISDPATGLTFTPVERIQNLLAEMQLADEVGLDLFGIGEHHRAEFLDSAPVVILAAAAGSHPEHSTYKCSHGLERG